MAFDVGAVRGVFPGLGDGWTHFDAAETMLVPELVGVAVATALRSPVSEPGGLFPASRRAEAITDAARRAVGDLVGTDPEGVVLGPSAAHLLRMLADALSESWLIGDEVVVSRLDHARNIVPWQQSTHRVGGAVRWAEIDIETGELPSWQFLSLVAEHTKVITVTAASGLLGTRPDLGPIADAAHSVGALFVVDCCVAAPRLPLDINELRADVVVVSAAAWGGPPVAALAFRDPELVNRIPSFSLAARSRGPARLELGPQPSAMLAGLVASVDYLASLDDLGYGPRRERVLTSMRSVEIYQTRLLDELTSQIRLLPGVRIIGDPFRRVPILALTFAGITAVQAVEHLVRRGICAFADPGVEGLFAALGIGEAGGAVILGLAHYTTFAEIDRLIAALRELSQGTSLVTAARR